MGDTEKTSASPHGERIKGLEVRMGTLERGEKTRDATVLQIRDEVIGLRPFVKAACWFFGAGQIVFGGLVIYALTK